MQTEKACNKNIEKLNKIIYQGLNLKETVSH
jgi:hypothetical protein